jgi:hypothetical protein
MAIFTGTVKDRAEAFNQILQNPISHYVGWDELVAEEKEDGVRRQNHTTWKPRSSFSTGKSALSNLPRLMHRSWRL